MTQKVGGELFYDQTRGGQSAVGMFLGLPDETNKLINARKHGLSPTYGAELLHVTFFGHAPFLKTAARLLSCNDGNNVQFLYSPHVEGGPSLYRGRTIF